VPGGHEAGDFSQEAITVSSAELLEWDGEQPSLLECLWKIILRHIKRYSARDENTKEQLSTTNPAEANSHVADVSNLRQTCYPEPEDNLSEEETIELILKKFRRHRDFKFIEIILREDVETPQEIAEKLGIKVKEVNNAQKRLRRNPYLLSLLRQRGGGNSS
jgi:DNA-directed RNA polymerase specialized sigma24 family protein